MPTTYFNSFTCKPSYGFAPVAVTSSVVTTSIDDRMTCTAGETIAIRDAVYTNFDGLAYKASALFVSSSFDIGFAVSGVLSGATFPVDSRHGKLVDNFSGLVSGSRYFLSESFGLISRQAPENTGSIVYQVGIAKTDTELIFYPEFLVRK